SRRISVGGRECLLIDTAGISADSPGQIEAAAQIAAQSQAEQADLTLLCIDASRPLAPREQCELEKSLDRRLVIATKCDLVVAVTQEPYADAISPSSRTGAGIDELRGAIEKKQNAAPGDTSVVTSTADRCRDSLRLAAQSLSRAVEAVEASAGEELIA